MRPCRISIFNSNTMKRRLILLILLDMMPLWILLAVYVYVDPFRVVHPEYPYLSKSRPMHTGWDKDVMSFETYQHNAESYRYDSFIFGSSLSMYYRVKDLSRFFPSAHPLYHFDASSETIDGILHKMQYITSHGGHIKNAFIVLSNTDLEQERQYQKHIFREHYKLTPECDFIGFHYTFVRAFFNLDFLLDYFCGNNRDADDGIYYDPVSNEITEWRLDDELQRDSTAFYQRNAQLFIDQYYDGVEQLPTILTEQKLAVLNSIAEILKRERTHYIILYPPRYHRTRLSPEDDAMLKRLFGEANIVDLSADKTSLAGIKTNFYDGVSHPTKSTCREILRLISNQYSSASDSH